MGKHWTEEEKALVREAKSEDDLAIKYLKKFGTADRSRVHSLFSHRVRLLVEGSVQQVKNEVAARPAQTIFAEDEVFAHISNKLSELIQVQKEMLDLFKRATEKKP